jgi:hypothetical protein
MNRDCNRLSDRLLDRYRCLFDRFPAIQSGAGCLSGCIARPEHCEQNAFAQPRFPQGNQVGRLKSERGPVGFDEGHENVVAEAVGFEGQQVIN